MLIGKVKANIVQLTYECISNRVIYSSNPPTLIVLKMLINNKKNYLKIKNKLETTFKIYGSK